MLKLCNYTRKHKIKYDKIKTTAYYIADTRYKLLDSYIINDKKTRHNSYCSFHILSLKINQISQNTDITSQLSTYTTTPNNHNDSEARIEIIIIHTTYFHMIVTVAQKNITP